MTFNAWLLNIVVWITLVGVPILILMQFQLTFLPYHLSAVTWIHRFLIVADLALIWFFWFAIYRRGRLHFPKLKAHPVALGFSAVVIFISIFVVAYPGERLAQLVNVKLPLVCPDKWRPISNCFLRGPVNMVTGRPQRYFFNVLVLPDQTLTDPEKAKAGQITTALRGRDLTGAILVRSDIRLVDFTGTKLDGARLDRARASGAIFGCDHTGDPLPKNADWPDHGCSSLRGASLLGANLSGAHFSGARMEGAVLINANLSGANLRNVHLEAAVLSKANLTAADMRSTQLHSAYLYATNLSGATLDESELGGALLEQSQFQFASVGQFHKVRVGDTIGRPLLNFAAFDLDGSVVPPPANVSAFHEFRNYMLEILLEQEMRQSPWLIQPTTGSKSKIDKTHPVLLMFLPEFYESLYRENSKTNWSSLKAEVDIQWTTVKDTPLYKEKNEDLASMKRRFLAERFAELACDGENAPFVARGLISNDVIARAGALADIFLAKVRDNQNCRGAAELKPHHYAEIELMHISAKSGGAIPDKTEIR